MSAFTLLTLMSICFKVLNAAGDITKYGFNDRMETSLKILCPGVDICDESKSTMNSNEILDGSGTVSCCHRCSCYKKCLASLTCCFPENNVTTNGNQESSLQKMSIPSRNLAISNGRGQPRQIPGLQIEDEITSLLSSVRKCLYSQTGIPGDTWSTTVPAYLMVSDQPLGGCKPSPNISQEIEDKKAHCDSTTIFPWGNLYPVYSKEQNTIYKNVECARCHGELDTIPWTATLVCENYDQTLDREVPLSEHFDFLTQGGGLSDTCFVSFHYPDPTVQIDNRCFMNTVKTCSLDLNDDVFVIPSEVNLTKSEVVTACQTGLNSPVEFRNAVYQNVFCAICNRPLTVQKLYCSADTDPAKDFGAFKLTYLLDTYPLYLTTPRNDITKKSSVQRVCLREGLEEMKESCRRLLCPAGQTRNSEGECVFASKRWYGTTFSLVIKLKPDVNTRIISSILDSFERGEINSETRLGGFKRTSPWPSYWKIVRILRLAENNRSDEEPLVAIELHTDITRPEVLTADILKSLSKPWNLIVNGKTFVFRQSQLEYSIRYGDRPSLPWWNSFIDPDLNLTIALAGWNTVYFDVHARIPYSISKLWTCQRVSLADSEYTLMANKYLMTSNLTKRTVMFDREFELAVTGDGQKMVHVCMDDTYLEQKGHANGCRRLAHSYLTRVMVFIYMFLCFSELLICACVSNHGS